MSLLFISSISFLMLLLTLKQGVNVNSINGYKKRNQNWFITFMVFSPFFCITAFRSIDAGIDTVQYHYLFYSIGNTIPISRLEPFFSYVVIFLREIGITFKGFLFIQALFYYLALSVLHLLTPNRNNFIYVLITITFVLFEFGMSGLRQSIAISLFVLSISYALRKRYALFLFLGFIAFGIHNSSIIPFILILISIHFKLSNRQFIIGVLFCPLLYFLDAPQIISIRELVSIKQLSSFEHDSVDTLNIKQPLFVWASVLVMTFLMVYGVKFKLINKKLINNISPQVKSLLLFGVLYMCSFFWLSTSFRLVDRLGFYFIPLFAVFTTYVMSSMKKTYLGRVVFLMISSVFILIFLFLVFKD